MATVKTSTLLVERVTTRIQIDSQVGEIPVITMKRATLWRDPTAGEISQQVIRIEEDDHDLQIQGTVDALNMSLIGICEKLGLDVNSASLFNLISYMTDYMDPEHNAQATSERIDPNAPFEEPETVL